MASTNKSCFVICPIGSPESEARQRSDTVLKHIITPAVEAHGYAKPERSDQIDDPGTITRQIIDRVHDADLVVADLTELNPNVFYELAVRQAFHKPVIMIGMEGTKFPFDVAHQRMIPYGLDLDSAAEARRRISEQARHFAEGGAAGDSPISHAASLRASAGDGLTGAVDVILSEIQALRREGRENFAALGEHLSANRIADALRGSGIPVSGLGSLLTTLPTQASPGGLGSLAVGISEEKSTAEPLSLLKRNRQPSEAE